MLFYERSRTRKRYLKIFQKSKSRSLMRRNSIPLRLRNDKKNKDFSIQLLSHMNTYIVYFLSKVRFGHFNS